VLQAVMRGVEVEERGGGGGGVVVPGFQKTAIVRHNPQMRVRVRRSMNSRVQKKDVTSRRRERGGRRQWRWIELLSAARVSGASPEYAPASLTGRGSIEMRGYASLRAFA